ncbi:MAG: hypothetical protein JJV88_03510 [Sulfurovum sp.]|nr:hypothetical protein [Sulfurovaceae bacterium]
MNNIKEESINLIYLDPPFFTKRKHTLRSKDRKKEFSFDDNWGSNEGYANFLYERINIMNKLLKDDGSIFVHCDKSGEHIVRAVLDKVFGEKNFQSEIIWSYKRWSNSKKGLLPTHQNIYFYSKTKNFKFNKVFTSYSETTNIDQILQRRTRDSSNKSIYDTDENGKIILGDEKKGVPLGDVWDIPYLNPRAKERVGYPTQKPLLLLDRIIKLTTDENDIVLDPFCGSGTTCVSAKLLGRDYIGIDESKEAIELANSRIKTPIKTESSLLKKGRASYLSADKKALNLLDGLEFNAVYRNKGIDAILVEQYEGTPILIRVQKEEETLSESASFLAKAMKIKKSKKSILIQTNHSGLFELDINFKGMNILKTPSVEISNILQN